MTKRAFCLIMMVLMVLSVQVSVGASGYDFGGATIGISTRFPEITPLGARGSFNFLDPDGRLQAHIEEIEALFNCTIEFIPHPNEYNVFTTFGPEILAGENRVHVIDVDITGSSTNLIPMAIGGYLHPLTDVLDREYYDSLPQAFRTTTAFDVNGVLYGFEATTMSGQVGLWWNKEMFAREGFPDLYDLYQSGEWTWEVLEDIALRATKDTSGDGEIDQFGFNLFWDLRRNAANFALTNGASLTEVVDGRIVVTIDDSAMVESMEFLQRLYQNGALSGGGTFMNGRVAMAMGNANVITNRDYISLEEDYGIVPLPRGPRSSSYVVPVWNRFMAVIPITVEDPRAIVELVSALRQLTAPYMSTDVDTWEQRELWETWSYYARDRETIEFWQWAMSNQVYLDNRELVLSAGLADAITQILVDGVNSATALSEVKPAIQGVIDELYQQ